VPEQTVERQLGGRERLRCGIPASLLLDFLRPDDHVRLEPATRPWRVRSVTIDFD